MARNMVNQETLNSKLVLSFLLLLCSGVLGEDALKFTEEPQNVIVLKGQPFTWHCSAAGQGPIDIKWRKDGHYIETNDRHQVLENGSLYFTAIESTEEMSDEGFYECLIQNNIGALVSIAELKIATMPQLKTQPESKSATTGQTIRLDCRARGLPTPTYRWLKDEEALSPSERFITLPTGVLQVHNVEESDSGNYKCIVENVAGVVESEVANLDVASGDNTGLERVTTPTFLTTPRTVRGKPGETAILECLPQTGILSHQITEITWNRKGGMSLDTDRMFKYGESNLQIRQLQGTDSGTYICTVKTSAGATSNRHIKLEVCVPPYLRVKPESVSRPVAATARFMCIAEGAPKPNVTWLKNGEKVRLGGRHTVTNSGDFLIHSVRNGQVGNDEGFYQCVAENVCGRVQASARLRVLINVNRPDPPQNFNGTPLSSTSVELSWTAPSTDHLGYPIIAHTVHYVPVTGGRELQAAIGGTVDSHILHGLEPYTNYSFYAVAYISVAASEHSEYIFLTTLEEAPSAAPSFSLTASVDSIVIMWDPIPPNKRKGEISLYRIYYREDGSTMISLLDVGQTHYVYPIKGLKADTVYYVSMSASNKAGEGPVQRWQKMKTAVREETDSDGQMNSDAEKPTSPVLDGWTVSNTSFYLTWTQKEESGKNGIIAYSLHILTESEDGEPVQKNNLAISKDITSYSVNNLNPKITYSFFVTAYTTLSISDPSNSVFKMRDSHQPTAPKNVNAITVSSTSIKVDWIAPTGPVDYYTVNFKLVSDGNTISVTVAGNVTTYTQHSLQADTEYEVNVTATFHGGTTGHTSNTISIKTDAKDNSEDESGKQPHHVETVALSSTSFMVSWQRPTHSHNVSLYGVHYRPVTGGKADEIIIDGSSTEYVLTDLQPDTSYIIYIAAYYNPFISNEITVSTPPQGES